MSKQVVATQSIQFSTGETFDGGNVLTLANKGDVLTVVKDHGTHLTVYNKEPAAVFDVYIGQYK